MAGLVALYGALGLGGLLSLPWCVREICRAYVTTQERAGAVRESARLEDLDRRLRILEERAKVQAAMSGRARPMPMDGRAF